MNTSPPGLILLITGGSGYLGREIALRAVGSSPRRRVYATFLSHPLQLPGVMTCALDLRDERAVIDLVARLQPGVIIHTAAIMGADGLLPADRPGEAWSLNVEGSAYLAASAARLGARLIHLSTDVIFDGEHAPYDESSVPQPRHRYGASKLAAEGAVAAACPNHVLVRTSLIYGFNPVDPRTRAVLQGQMNRLFVDEYRNPVWVCDLAEALLELGATDYAGTLNVAGPQRLSRYEFGLKLLQAHGLDPALVTPAHAAESPSVRPRDCTLDISRARQLLSSQLRSVDEVLARRWNEAPH